IAPAVLAATIALCLVSFALPARAATAPNQLSPKQLQTVQMLLDTYGVPQDKIKAVTMILLASPRTEGDATSTKMLERMDTAAGSSTMRIDGKHGSTTPGMTRPPRPEDTTGAPQ